MSDKLVSMARRAISLGLLIIAVTAFLGISSVAICRGEAWPPSKPLAEDHKDLGEVRSGLWKGHVESDWLRQAGTSDDPVKLKVATAGAMKLAQTTLSFVQRSAPCPALASELALLQGKIAGASSDADWKGLYLEARWLRRRILLSHPLLDFDRLLISKCPPTMFSHMCDQHLGRWSRPGPGLSVLDSWKDDPRSRPLLKDKLPVGSVLHPDLSFDAKRVLFSFCDHTVEGLEERNSEPEFLLSTANAFAFAALKQGRVTPGQRATLAKGVDHLRKAGRRQFFIYEAEIDGSSVRQLTGTGSDPMAGWDDRQTVLIEDLDPCYLPGGGFVFVSTRCQNFGRCHGGRYAPGLVMYRAEADGSNIRRISPGETNEWEPSVLPDGRIIFCRWDYINRENQRTLGLWVCRPDGTDLAHYYKSYSTNPCMTSEALAIPGSHQIVCTAAAHHSYTAGSIITVDPHQGEDGLRPLRRITSEVRFPETEDRAGSLAGSFASPYPLSENLFFVSYSPDQLGYSKQPRANGYAIFLVDTLGGRELIYRDPEMSCFSPIPIQPRPTPPVLPSVVQENCQQGTFVVQDVYRSQPGVEWQIKPGSIRRLRVISIHPQPAAGRAYSSIVHDEVVKGIVGTVPVSADGSVAFWAPADVPLMFQLLDENGMAVMTMRSQTHVRPGETVGCVGCHESRHTTPGPAAVASTGVRVLSLDPPAGPQYEGGLSFARTVQPVLDRYCIRCHGLEKKDGNLDLLGTPTTRAHTGYELGFNVAYESLVKRPELIAMAPHDASLEERIALVARGGTGSLNKKPLLDWNDFLTRYRQLAQNEWVALAWHNLETMASTPRDYYAHAGRLAGYLLGEHRQHVVLDRESFERIVQWLDLNGQYYGDYSWNRPERRDPSPEGERSLRQHVKAQCGACHATMADQPLAALINIALPQESRVLKAPLSRQGAGWGLCKKETWPDTTATKYQDMLHHVLQTAGLPARADIAGTCGQQPCICGSCWVRKLHAGSAKKKNARRGDSLAPEFDTYETIRELAQKKEQGERK